MIFNIWFEFTSLLFLILIIISFSMSRSFPSKKARHFRFYLWIAVINLSSNIISSIMISYPQSVPLWLNYAVSEVFYLSQFIMSMSLVYYIMLLCGYLDGNHKAVFYTHIIVSCLVLLCIMLNPLTHWFFGFTSDLTYYRGGGLAVLLTLAGLNLIFAFLIAFRKRKTYQSVSLWALGLFSLFVVAFFIIQMKFPSILLSGTSITFGTLMLYLDLQTPQDQKDPLTKTYTRKAFSEYCEEMLSKHRSFPIVFADIKNTSAFNKTFGETNGNILIKTIASRLMHINSKNLVFRYTGDSFMIIIRSRKSFASLVEELAALKKQSIELSGVTYEITIQSFCFTQIKQMASPSELANVLEYSILKCKETNGEPLIVTRSIIDEARRSEKVEKTLSYTLENRTLRVMLQPIYDIKQRKPVFAEAMCTIDDPELGTILPEEFIPIAEKTGQIELLHAILLSKVCNQLSLIPKGNKPMFEAISVDLSVSDCINPNLAEETIAVIRHYNVDPKMLVFEITETMATISSFLPENMKKLAAFGVGFSCEGFGTGYANLDTVAKLPFHTAKLDRSIISMISNEKERTIITQLIALLRELGLETVAMDVKNEEEARMVIESGAHYIESPFFFKPFPIERLSKPADEK
ncbi:MAG: GGDEF domain-containing phosphodiesterase [Sphaerochaetaceae bacterium]|jgi:diguanylate cyclase (GGDEF)-like protein|nr:GGDEF domain-containing phosphodiesterase [Sphaerochaetaceae bacterium]MDD3163134.1 GGDEF domain-containing phosphodiesterase [Sphaerochaetaceae bacterium]MDD4006429.1 GGDEF domain-containing phosphodiesterase [Sphaerochaetaceae bacterium]MDD4396961.1 GGDEF domain-containing phosphodiesterase [Sphaerochaetaceae bacterium]